MIEDLRRYNFTVIGIFFLTWSMNSFFLFGEYGRLFVLIFGFLLITYSAAIIPNKKGSLGFILTSLLFLFLYIIISIFLNQNTTGYTNIIYIFICYILFISGHLVGKNYDYNNIIKNEIVFIFCILTIASDVYIFNMINGLKLANRTFHSEINPVGLAYANSLIFIFIYSIFWHKEKRYNRIFKTLIIFSLSSTLIVIFLTQSRGALIFLLLTIILFNVVNFKIQKLFLYKLIIIILLTLSFVIGKNILIDNYPKIGFKIIGAIERFNSLLLVSDNINRDPSSKERALMIDFFLNEFPSFIVFGQQGYTPYPHNQFIEILMRWGLFGVPLLLLSFYALYKSIKNLKNIIYSSFTGGLITLLFIFSYLQSLTSLSLEMNRTFWLGFGFILSYKKMISKHE